MLLSVSTESSGQGTPEYLTFVAGTRTLSLVEALRNSDGTMPPRTVTLSREDSKGHLTAPEMLSLDGCDSVFAKTKINFGHLLSLWLRVNSLRLTPNFERMQSTNSENLKRFTDLRERYHTTLRRYLNWIGGLQAIWDINQVGAYTHPARHPMHSASLHVNSSLQPGRALSPPWTPPMPPADSTSLSDAALSEYIDWNTGSGYGGLRPPSTPFHADLSLDQDLCVCGDPHEWVKLSGDDLSVLTCTSTVCTQVQRQLRQTQQNTPYSMTSPVDSNSFTLSSSG